MFNNAIYAVLTGDVIGSSRFASVMRVKMLSILKDSFKNIEEIILPEDIISPFVIYRGDSFQGVISRPEMALSVAIGIRTGLISGFKKRKKRLDARIAIGIGTIEFLPEDQGLEGTGEAFINSGRTLDTMKKSEQNIIIRTPCPKIDDEFRIECLLLDALIRHWTYEQSQAVLKQIQGMKQEQIAKDLGISQPAVGQRLKKASARAYQELINRYKQNIENCIRSLHNDRAI